MINREIGIDRDGFAAVARLLPIEHVYRLLSDLAPALRAADTAVLQSRGLVCGVHNLIEVWPPALAVARAALRELVAGSCASTRKVRLPLAVRRVVRFAA